ncbi:pantothenate transporter [Lasiosphaeria miniovina]|uniref:Pantothenate transporter n=1 Tax=Lasiosphaeria miniovina TaxID=1954250 RepID=A0AA40AWY3_9PEZI|nr:pantothenate transporter [Lasiosphaeria miniovina]KAK0723524.1 pantothenate transporter [Lasiosphaeria miniovina]
MPKLSLAVSRRAPGEGERRLVRKIDFFILTFCCLSYFLNYLDRSNVSNAYVSGMKEDVGFEGDQLNQINTCLTVGYVIGQIPSNLVLNYVKPRFFFPAMMAVWACLTMLTASARSPQAVMAIRFFQGIAESSTFRHLHGLITLPVALYGLLLFPDTPATTAAYYLAPAERALAVSRLPPADQASAKAAVFSWAFVRSVLSSWEWWGFVVLWIIAGETESFSSNSLLALYMKNSPTTTYSIAQLNNYPTGVPAVGIVSTLFWATLTDAARGKRYLVGYFIAATGVATSAMVLAAESRNPGTARSEAVVFAAYYWAGAVYACQATFFAWANDAMRAREPVFRAVVLAGMNLGSNSVNAWWSIVFYGASMAPWFTRGMYAMIAVSVALGVWTAGLVWVSGGAEAKSAAASGDGRHERESDADVPFREARGHKREQSSV